MCLLILLCLLRFSTSLSLSLDEEFTLLQEGCRKLIDDNRKLTYLLQELKDDNEKISYTLSNLKQSVIDVDSYYRVENLEILGVPKTKNEDLFGILHSISQAISVPFNVSDVSCVWRRQEVSGTNYYKQTKVDSIVVRFVSRTMRNKWLSKGRKYVGINTKQCLPDLPESEIYVNEHLSNTKKTLMKTAKQLEEEHKILYAWLKDGNLYIRRTPNGKAIKIKSYHDLQVLGLVK